jgi:hypothetical protein
MMDALLAASEKLAEAMRADLLADGQAAELDIRIEGNRAVIGSRSRALAVREVGSSASPPTGALSRSARAAIPAVISAMRQQLSEKP